MVRGSRPRGSSDAARKSSTDRRHLIGGALGCLLALPINGIVTSTTNFSSFSELAFAFRVTPDILLAGMIFSAGMGIVGGFLPALRAARHPIAAALRGG